MGMDLLTTDANGLLAGFRDSMRPSMYFLTIVQIGGQMTRNLLRRAWPLAALLAAFFLPVHSSFADTVQLKLDTGVIATADFRPGKPSRPAILLLHGFLQTRNVLPISPLANTLADIGYTVLVPTLSLGINQRAQSLDCEAPHLHTKEGDVAEIGHWTDWLARKGYKSIVLVGHSSGSLEILQYVSRNPNTAVKTAILTSIIPLRSVPEDVQKALASVKQGNAGGKLERYTLGYCKGNYVAPAADYLTYAVSDAGNTLDQFSKTRIPVEVILGGADKAFGSTWPQKIRARNVSVTVIDGATHFFDGMQEFDLSDKVESILEKLPAGHN
jgi:dienelactone hydrolase